MRNNVCFLMRAPSTYHNLDYRSSLGFLGYYQVSVQKYVFLFIFLNRNLCFNLVSNQPTNLLYSLAWPFLRNFTAWISDWPTFSPIFEWLRLGSRHVIFKKIVCLLLKVVKMCFVGSNFIVVMIGIESLITSVKQCPIVLTMIRRCRWTS